MSAVFTRNGVVVDESEIKLHIAKWAINGYDDVPFTNLLRYVKTFENIASSLPISETSWKMICDLAAHGYDWRE